MSRRCLICGNINPCCEHSRDAQDAEFERNRSEIRRIQSDSETRYPRTEADLRRAQRELDAESLAIHINRRLHRDGVLIGDLGRISSIVAELAPGWEYADATRVSDNGPRVVLTMYNPHHGYDR